MRGALCSFCAPCRGRKFFLEHLDPSTSNSRLHMHVPAVARVLKSRRPDSPFPRDRESQTGTSATPREPRSSSSPGPPAICMSSCISDRRRWRTRVGPLVSRAPWNSKLRATRTFYRASAAQGSCPHLPLSCHPNANSTGAPLTATIHRATTNEACRDTGC